ncbi:general transcription factor IIH subunit 5 [Sitodiplosis mosellana]|uniref:general transcription factor IIH subunit 5 n=1 Tax=Sitodiplosis mosellana TaxID=263140 RepID=UPI0024441998|nr:general transcription factor IIH subunit 5 [Sitodiplosis mosellana]
MVNLVKGVLVTCDPAMKQFLLHLDEKQAFGKKFILLNLDDTHLFISVDIVETLQNKFDDLMDRISFPLHERGD